MAQKITISIAGHEYEFKVESQQDEEIWREAAKIVNQQIQKKERNLTGQTSYDVLAMAALTISIGFVMRGRELKKTKQEIEALRNEIAGYLEKIEKI